MEKPFKRKNHLRASLGNHAPLKDGQQFPQKLSGKANSNIKNLGLCFIYGKANNQASRKAETKTFSKKHYKVY